MKTNFDCLKSMSIDEMHDFLIHFYEIMRTEAFSPSYVAEISYNEAIKRWLEAPALRRMRFTPAFKAQIKELSCPPKTNYERIIVMSLEEMHKFFVDLHAKRITTGEILELPEEAGKSYNDCIKIWLGSEAKN